MKKIYSAMAFAMLALFLGCSPDDTNDTENGANHAPNLKATGKSAHDFLSAEDYENLEIEILYVGDFSPSAQTLENLKSFLQARLHKPGGITISQKQIPSPGSSPYDNDEIAAIEATSRSKYNNANVLSMCFLFVDGKFNTDTGNSFTLGTAYRNTSCVVYENSIRNFSNLTNTDRTKLETIVILHEFCHLLGLVNLGTPMQHDHQDQAHGKHCSNAACLMYWQTENNVAQMGPNQGLPQLDADCLADLQANGGR